MKKKNEFKPLWNLVKEEKVKIIFASLLIFFVEIINTFTGYLHGSAVEAITNLKIKEALIFLCIYYMLGVVFDSIAYYGISGSFQKLESKITRKLEFNAFKKALYLPAYAFEKFSSGEIINRINNDASTLSFAFLHILELASSIIAAFCILVYVFIDSWIIGIEILIFLVVVYFIVKRYNPLLVKLHKQRKKIGDEFTSLTNESIRGIREVKTLGIKKRLIKNMLNINSRLLDKSIEEVSLNTKYKTTTSILRNTLEFFIYASCIILLFYGKISLTFLVAMTYYVYNFTRLIERINYFNEVYQKMYVSLQRVNEILENRLYDDEKFGNKMINNIKGVIEFKDINFGYPNEKQLLRDFNLKLEPNKKIAIVGASGGGKSTIFNLLTRVFDPDSGVISIDGIDIRDLSEQELRKQVSIIRQEPFIFNRTIFENFKLIDEEVSLEEVRKYSKIAYLDDYIMSLPEKYDTILGEGGVNLSGGQKQRLSIARTLLKKSKIILFDEATSALDNNSQKYIKESIDNLVKNHTVIIVAHRLSTIVDADIIYIIENGKVSDSGNHDYLLKNNKLYRNLYEKENLNSEE